jgi:tetratricopeptide (TPR) repeat protein
VPGRPLLLALLASLSGVLACASAPDDAPEARDPEVTWQRATDTARRAQRSQRMGELVIAERSYEKALAAARTFPEGDPRLLETRTALARLHRKQGRYRLAIRELDQLVPEHERVNGADSEPVRATRLALCGAQVDAGRYRDALGSCQRVLASQQGDPSASGAALGVTQLQLARAEAGLRRYPAAEARYERVLELAKASQESGPSAALAVGAHNGLGRVYARQRRFADAEPLQLKALSILVRRRAWRSPEYPRVLRDLGDLYVETRRYAEARERYDRALEEFEKTFGEQHFEVKDTLLRIADLLVRTGQARQAAELRYKAESIPDPRT